MSERTEKEKRLLAAVAGVSNESEWTLGGMHKGGYIWHWGRLDRPRSASSLFRFRFLALPLIPVREFATEGTEQRSGRTPSNSM